ncbi:MAG: hypothetical protein JW840_00560 [Candidatus Thermoplasmatota archaeon]|nr:hypothetical protein [Candidatus Thermoplasmatota archaeon]
MHSRSVTTDPNQREHTLRTHTPYTCASLPFPGGRTLARFLPRPLRQGNGNQTIQYIIIPCMNKGIPHSIKN